MAVRDIFTKDLGWKVFSVAVAVVVWKTISNEAPGDMNTLAGWETEVFTNLPVQVVSADTDVTGYTTDPQEVTVRISARPEIVKSVQATELKVRVEISSADLTSNLRKDVDVSVPDGVQLINASPAEVRVLAPPDYRQTP